VSTKSESESESENRSKLEIRQDLVDAASQLLRGKRVDDFSTTKVAEDADTSRQMIYTLFGGKSELIKAVYQYTVDGLSEELSEVDEDDPIDQFYQLGVRYRDFMTENAALFDRMLSLEATQNYTAPEPLVTRTVAHEHFDAVLEDCIEAGILQEDTDVEKLTDILWAGVNGIIRLQLIGYYPDEETAREHYYELAFRVLGGGDSPKERLE